MKVGIVLDTTAVLAYARIEGVAVGELIGVVQDDGGITGVPVLVLVDAGPQLDKPERELIEGLLSRGDEPPAVALPLTAELVGEVAELALGHGHAIAHTIAAAHALDAVVATYAPERYRGPLDDDDLLPLA